MARIIFLHEKKLLLMERSCRSWRILCSIPYPNLELNVVRQVVKGYRGSKWYISHFIWENGHDTKVRFNITGNESVHVGIRLGWAAYQSLKTYPYLNFSNIWLLTSSVQKRVPVFESEHDENWELWNTHTVKENMCEHIFEPIRKYWLNDLSNIFFFLGQNFIVHSSLARRKKAFMHPKQQNDTILKLYIPFEGCRESVVSITGYFRFQLRHIWARGVSQISYQHK